MMNVIIDQGYISKLRTYPYVGKYATSIVLFVKPGYGLLIRGTNKSDFDCNVIVWEEDKFTICPKVILESE